MLGVEPVRALVGHDEDCCVSFGKLGCVQPVILPSGDLIEQVIDEFDCAYDSWLRLMNVTSFDGPDCLDAA